MLEQDCKELVIRMKNLLSKMDHIIYLYKEELKEGRFRPRNGEKWERTVEKQIVEVAIAELHEFDEQKSLEEMCKLVDEMEDFAKKARVIDDA